LKKLILSFLTICLFAGAGYAQLKVEAAGVKVGAETTPVEALDVEGALKVGTTSNTNAGTIRYSGTDFEGYVGGEWKSLTGGVWSKNSGNDAYFSEGRIGIGFNAPLQPLHIRTNSGASGFLFDRTDNPNFVKLITGTNGSAFYFSNDHRFQFTPGDNIFDVNADFSNLLVVFGTGQANYGGRVGIGTMTPGAKLHVNGSIMHEGTVTMSDARLKKNVKPLEYGLEAVMRLTPIKYEYNGRANTTDGAEHIGLFAQDLQRVVPELVEEHVHRALVKRNMSIDDPLEFSSEETFLRIRDNEVKYILLNAIKEQQQIIQEQSTKVASLEDRINKLENLLPKLSKQEALIIKKND